MPATLYDQYATKICQTVELEPKSYEAYSLNTVVMTLPLAEAHAAADGIELEALPRLGESVSLKSHMQTHFFDVIGYPNRPIIMFTAPILVQRHHLERLEGWRDWRTLTVYLNQADLNPVMVFRNTPISLKADYLEKKDYYVADVRVRFERDQPFHWNG